MGRTFVIILAWALQSGAAKAYPTPIDLDGELHRWPITIEAPSVLFEISVQDDSLRQIFLDITSEAAKIWSQVPNSMLKVENSIEDNTAQITVNFNTSIAGGDMAAGYAIFDQVKDGVPKHCSIYIAADDSTDFYNLSKTTLHEMGHCLGLAHSLVPESIMSYKLEANTFALALDDEAAISRLYPADGSEAKLAPGCAIRGVDQTTRPNGPVMIVIFLLPCLILLTRRIMTRVVKI